mgnify:CR=1 FL=1
MKSKKIPIKKVTVFPVTVKIDSKEIRVKIINRPKKGFNIPVAQWLAGELRPLLMDLLSSARIEAQGIFNSSYIQTLIQEHISKRRDHRKLLWTLLVFQLWHQKYLE